MYASIAMDQAYHQPHPTGMDVDEAADPELAAALEASYRAQMPGGAQATEDEMMAQAMELSRLEEEARQRRADGGADSAPSHSGIEDEVAEARLPEVRAPRVPREDRYDRPAEQDDRFDARHGGAGALGVGHMRQPLHSRPGGAPLPTREFAEDDDDLAMLVDPHGPGGRGGELGGDQQIDPHLAAAIEASYRAQTSTGRQDIDEDMIAQAIRQSQVEDESRQRNALREQQEMELRESMLMDQMRETEERQRLQEAEQLRILEEQEKTNEAARAGAAKAEAAAELQAKRSRVPAEPPTSEPNRLDIQIRMPNGRRLRRAFRGTDSVGQVYDYVDIEMEAPVEDGAAAAAASNGGASYRLVSTMPRRVYENRAQSLAEAGLQGQCALLVEAIVSA